MPAGAYICYLDDSSTLYDFTRRRAPSRHVVIFELDGHGGRSGMCVACINALARDFTNECKFAGLVSREVTRLDQWEKALGG